MDLNSSGDLSNGSLPCGDVMNGSLPSPPSSLPSSPSEEDQLNRYLGGQGSVDRLNRRKKSRCVTTPLPRLSNSQSKESVKSVKAVEKLSLVTKH